MSGDGDISELVSEDFKLSADFTPEEYEKTWADRLCSLEDRDEREKVFEKFYNHVWNLLFGPEANADTRSRAIALLIVERPDAAFLNPFAYNDWIRTVKDEIMKRGMTSLWKDKFVPKELGLVWARDSDYFDDMDDPEPAQFYKLTEEDDTVAPWIK